LFFNQNEMTGTARSENGEIIIDGQPFPIGAVGSLHMKITQQLVNGYLSIGGNFLYFDRPHHWALGGELGVIYTEEPDVSLTRRGPPSGPIDSAIAGAEKRLQNYADQFKWLPVLTIKLSYAF